MKIRSLFLTVLCGCVLFTTVAAQDAGKSKKTGEPPPPVPKVDIPADAQAEEIEIMRRLLDRALAKQQHALVATSVPNTATYPNSNLLTPLFDNAPPVVWNPTGSSLVVPNNYPLTTVKPYQSLATWSDAHNLNQLYSYHPNADHLAAELRSPQGVYLKNYGVVYTATLTLPTDPPVSDPNKPTPKPLTDWERTRQELHGEKIEPAKTPPPQESIADAVLRVLAKNGRHFSTLAETEQVTVSLTLSRAQATCMVCHPSPVKSREIHTIPRGTTGSSGNSSGSGNATSGSSSGSGNPTELKEQELLDKVAALKKDAQKAALLGDLHLKQGKNEQAAASFEEALRAYQESASELYRFGLDRRGTPEKDPTLEQELVVTGTKLIQAYTALGKTEEVRKTLKALDDRLQKTGAETPNKAADTLAKEELPAKLVISAPKKLLDLVGAEKITFEEFRKNATVEYQAPRTIEKRATNSPTSQP